MKKHPLCCLVLLLIGLALIYRLTCCGNNAVEWTSDLPAALRKARETGAPLLVLCTNKKDEEACVDFRVRVLEAPEFRQWARENKLLLVVQDCTNASAPETAGNALREPRFPAAYDIVTYPSAVLMDSHGIPFSEDHSATPVLGQHFRLLKNGLQRCLNFTAALSRADSLRGAAKASALAGALRSLHSRALDFCVLYTDLPSRVTDADPQDKTGFRRFTDYRRAFLAQKKEIAEQTAEVLRTVKPPKTLPALREKCEQLLQQRTDLLPESRQFIYMICGGSCFHIGDMQHALTYYEAALNAAPESEQAAGLKSVLSGIRDTLNTEKAPPQHPAASTDAPRPPAAHLPPSPAAK